MTDFNLQKYLYTYDTNYFLMLDEIDDDLQACLYNEGDYEVLFNMSAPLSDTISTAIYEYVDNKHMAFKIYKSTKMDYIKTYLVLKFGFC